MPTISQLVSSVVVGSLWAHPATLPHVPSGSLVSVTHYTTGAPNLDLHGITLGSDGAVWYTETKEAILSRMTTAGQVTTYPLKFTVGTQQVLFHPGAIATGADGRLYIGGAELGRHALGVFSPSGGLKVVTVPGGDGPGELGQLTLGPGGLIWFSGNNHVGSLSPSGALKLYKVPVSYGPLTTGPDGNLWFASNTNTNPVVGYLNPSTGAVTTYSIAEQFCAGVSIIAWNGYLVVYCSTFTQSSTVELVDTSGNQTPLFGLPNEQTSIQVLLAPAGSLPLVAVGDTLAAFDATNRNYVHALLPPKTFVGPMTIGSDSRIWSLDGPNGTLDAISLNAPLSSSSSVTWQQFALPRIRGGFLDMNAGSDGAIWLSAQQGAAMVRVDANGKATRYKLLVTVSSQQFPFYPGFFAVGSDGNFYVEGQLVHDAFSIAVVTTAGVVTHVYSLASGLRVGQMTPGPDGNVWFSALGNVGYITTKGAVKTYAVANVGYDPIVTGADGNLWVTGYLSSSFQTVLDSVVPGTGKVTTFPLAGCTAGGQVTPLASQVDVACPQSFPFTANSFTVGVTPSGKQTVYSGVAGQDLITGRHGQALFAMAPGGLGILVPSQGVFIQYPSPFPYGGIVALSIDGAGGIWGYDFNNGAIDKLTLH